jgi:hypothetical protein
MRSFRVIGLSVFMLSGVVIDPFNAFAQTAGTLGFDGKFNNLEKQRDRLDSDDVKGQGVPIAPDTKLYSGVSVSGGHDSNLDHNGSSAQGA